VSAENRLIVSGVVCNPPESRNSPAGIPLTRFTLEHRSQQVEATLPRDTYFKIVVIAAGAALKQVAVNLQRGDEVCVEGFLSRMSYREDEARMALHAQTINKQISVIET